MKTSRILQIPLALLLAATPLVTKATTFFTENFTNGSTLNSLTPANPTSTNTAYELVSSKSWSPAPTLTANDLKFGIAATSSGYIEAQALFATNAVALTQPGDYIQLTVVFTNTTGLLTAAGQLGFGLYNSGQAKPVAGGINNTIGNTYTGSAQNWLGYAADINFTGAASRILTRPAQAGTTGLNQDLVTFGTSSSYAGSGIVGSTTANATLVAGSTYTEVLTITLNDVNSLAITNTLYAGPTTGGTVVTNFGSIATNTTYLTSGFDALAIGYCGRSTAGGAPLIHVSSINVDGSVTTVSTPPDITSQPVSVVVPNGGTTVFNVGAQGVNVSYQWRRNGTNLLNGGNISGATSDTLLISPASAADVASGAVNGYYVVVTGAGNFSTNSTKVSLSLGTARSLVWNGPGADWDLNINANFLDPVNPTAFNYGDSINFPAGGSPSGVVLTGKYLTASSVTVDGNYAFTGTGSFAGPGNLICRDSTFLDLGNANTYSGGTLISNASASALVYLRNYSALGTGPVTLATPGTLEILPTGAGTVGINGDILVKDDFTIQADGTGTFAGQFLGSLSVAAGKTLTLTPKAPFATGPIRFRVGGTNTLINGNINLIGNPTASGTAQFDGTVLAFYAGSGTQTYNGVISGDGGLISRAGGTTLLNGVNTFTGGTTPTSGSIGLGNDAALGAGPLSLSPENGGNSGSGTIFASGGARTIANPIQFPIGTNNYTLTVNGNNDLTFTGGMNLAGLDGGTISNHTFTVNNTGATTFSGIISDSALAIGLVKNGTNALYLNGANTYSGLTTVSAGRLAGSGSLAGSVLVTTTNASIGGGAAGGIGTLTVGGDLTLTNGGGFFRINRAGSARDQVSVTGGLTNIGSGIITVTNLGATLQVGDTFALFNKAVTGGATLSVTGGGVLWTNKLALNGTIQVLPSIPTTPTNLTFVVAGSTLTVSWPASYLGWSLQSNAVSLSSTSSWFVVPGSTATTSMNFTANPTKTNVFYRMVLP